jgi:hypothetical protein|tara:strand:- start:1565 stop:3130 length:1566 start_codon:yes stop_codon:yes gene_type:complete
MANYTTAKSRYNTLEAIRDPYLDRARDASEFTIPSIMPREHHTGHTTLYTPYQGIGARGVNNLSSKLLLALLPPNQPFFRLTLDEFTLSELSGRDDMKGEFEKAMGSIERVVMNEMEVNNFRNALFEALKHLLICGNVLLYITPEFKMKVYHLDRFVVKRDGVGSILEIITKDMVSPSSLTEEQKELIDGDKDKDGYENTCEIYTCVKRSANGKKWEVHQEINEKTIPSSIGSYPLDKNAFIPLRYTSIDNADYGRGFIEEYIGDLRSLEALYRAIVEGSAASSKVLFLVKPNGSTRLKTLSESPNGAIREGNAEDVTTLQVNKSADFTISFQTIKIIEERLQFAFMLNASVQRNNDRVTATEINYVSKELDDSLGGLYSLLSQELQLPLINRLTHQMEKKKALPPLPKDSVRPKIVTGLEALGRSSDLQRLNTFVNQLQPFADQLMTYLNLEEYVKRVGTSLGVEMNGLIKSQEQIAQEQQAMQEQMMMQQNSPVAVKEGMGMVRDSVKQDREENNNKEN